MLIHTIHINRVRFVICIDKINAFGYTASFRAAQTRRIILLFYVHSGLRLYDMVCINVGRHIRRRKPYVKIRSRTNGNVIVLALGFISTPFR